MLNRRTCLSGVAGLSLTALAGAVRAQAEPKLVYVDGLMPGWSIGGWAKNTPVFVMDDQKPVQVTMDPWGAMTFQTTPPLDTKPYKTLTVVVHGGDTGKQEFTLTARLGEKVLSNEINLRCDKGVWGRVDIPLSKMKIKAPIDTLFFQNTSPDKLDPFYINFVLFQ